MDELFGALVFVVFGSMSITCFMVAIRIWQCPEHYWERIKNTYNPTAKKVLIQRMLNKEYY